jgi:hypothetical protein
VQTRTKQCAIAGPLHFLFFFFALSVSHRPLSFVVFSFSPQIRKGTRIVAAEAGAQGDSAGEVHLAEDELETLTKSADADADADEDAEDDEEAGEDDEEDAEEEA